MREQRPGPFRVKDCALITLALGRAAQNLRELRDRISDAPLDSLYHHFHQTLLRPTFDDPEFRNDFALWARRQLHDFHLAEQLAIIDPYDHADLEELRQRLLDVIETRLSEVAHTPSASPGREFHFMKSQVVVLDAGLRASTPADLAALIPSLPVGSVFYHFVEARRRPPAGVDDFSAWLAGWGPAFESTRRRLEEIDFYLWTLTEMRERIAASFQALPALEVSR